jgi:glutamine phosphoribosylpyrophosphate amidotransferase
MDSEIIVHLLAKRELMGRFKTMVYAMFWSQLKGSYSAVFLYEDYIIGARDPQGFSSFMFGKAR